MRLPKAISLGNETVKVEAMPTHVAEQGYRGLFFSTEEGGRIQIYKGMADSTQAAVLIHEVCHAILEPLKLNASREERIVRQLEVGLTDLLRGNPTLIHRLTRHLRGLPD